MKRAKLEDMTVDQLVRHFTSVTLDQDEALLMDELGKFNRLFQQMEEIKQELKRRPGDQRRALISLFGHANAQVRLKAAKATLALAPETARGVLQSIVESREFPQALEAGMSLQNLERATFKPS